MSNVFTAIRRLFTKISRRHRPKNLEPKSLSRNFDCRSIQKRTVLFVGGIGDFTSSKSTCCFLSTGLIHRNSTPISFSSGRNVNSAYIFSSVVKLSRISFIPPSFKRYITIWSEEFSGKAGDAEKRNKTNTGTRSINFFMEDFLYTDKVSLTCSECQATLATKLLLDRCSRAHGHNRLGLAARVRRIGGEPTIDETAGTLMLEGRLGLCREIHRFDKFYRIKNLALSSAAPPQPACGPSHPRRSRRNISASE